VFPDSGWVCTLETERRAFGSVSIGFQDIPRPTRSALKALEPTDNPHN